MSIRIASRPLRTAVIHFLCFPGACAAIAAAAKVGIIDSANTKRCLGFCVAAIMADIGNLLPKLRPLRLPGIEPAKAIAAERFAGWTLYLAAVMYAALFGFAALDEARLGAAAVGISAIILIACNWSWLLRDYPLRGLVADPNQVSAPTGETNGAERRLIACLLFSFVYVLLTACLVYLFGSSELLALWTTVGFSAAFAVFYSLLGSGRPGQHC